MDNSHAASANAALVTFPSLSDVQRSQLHSGVGRRERTTCSGFPVHELDALSSQRRPGRVALGVGGIRPLEHGPLRIADAFLSSSCARPSTRLTSSDPGSPNSSVRPGAPADVRGVNDDTSSAPKVIRGGSALTSRQASAELVASTRPVRGSLQASAKLSSEVFAATIPSCVSPSRLRASPLHAVVVNHSRPPTAATATPTRRSSVAPVLQGVVRPVSTSSNLRTKAATATATVASTPQAAAVPTQQTTGTAPIIVRWKEVESFAPRSDGNSCGSPRLISTPIAGSSHVEEHHSPRTGANCVDGGNVLSLPTPWERRVLTAGSGEDCGAAKLRIEPVPLHEQSDTEFGVGIVSDGGSARCIPKVYDSSTIAQYWLTQAKGMDDFLSKRVTLSSTESLRVKVATSVDTLERLFHELDSRVVYSKEDRFRQTQRETVDKMIYEISRKHIDAIERARKEAQQDLLEREKLQKHQAEQQVQQQLLREGEAAEDVSIDVASPTSTTTNSQSGASKWSGSPLTSPSRRRRRPSLAVESVDAPDGTAAAFSSNLQNILEATEPSEALLELTRRGVESDSDSESLRSFEESRRRPSAFETDPFAMASRRVGGLKPLATGTAAGVGGPSASTGVACFLSPTSAAAVGANGADAAAPPLALPGCILEATSGEVAPQPYNSVLVPLGSSSVPSAAVTSKLNGSGRRDNAVPLETGRHLPPSDAADEEDDCGDAGIAVFLQDYLQTDEDRERLAEINCLAEVSKKTLDGLRDMYEAKRYQEYLMANSTLHFRAKEPIDQRGSGRSGDGTDGAYQNRAGSPASSCGSPNDGDISAPSAQDAGEDTERKLLAERLASVAMSSMSSGTIKDKKKKALDLTNLSSKYSTVAGGKEAGRDSSTAAITSNGVVDYSTRLDLESKSGVTGVRVDEGVLDRDLTYAFYGNDPLSLTDKEGPQSTVSSSEPSKARFAENAVQHLRTALQAKTQTPVSPLSSPKSATAKTPRSSSTVFYRTISYWVKNVSLQDEVSLVLSVDPKKQLMMNVVPIQAIRVATRPGSFLCQVPPCCMQELLRWSYVDPSPTSEGDMSGAPTKSEREDRVQPRYHVDTAIVKRTRRYGVGQDTNEDSSRVPSGAATPSSFHNGSMAFEPGVLQHQQSIQQLALSRHASRKSGTGLLVPAGHSGSIPSPAPSPTPSNHNDEEQKRKERAELLKQAMAQQSRRRSLSEASPLEGNDGSGDDAGDKRPSKRSVPKAVKSSRRSSLSSSRRTSVATTLGDGSTPTESRRESNVSFLGGADPLGSHNSIQQSPRSSTNTPTLATPTQDDQTVVTFQPQRRKKGTAAAASAPPVLLQSTQEAEPPSPTAGAPPPAPVTGAAVGKKKALNSGTTTAPPVSSTRTASSTNKPSAKQLAAKATTTGKKRRSSHRVVMLSTEELFDAGGIQATVTHEDILSPSAGNEEPSEEVPSTMDASATSSLAAQRLATKSSTEDDEIDENALFEALFREEAEHEQQHTDRSSARTESAGYMSTSLSPSDVQRIARGSSPSFAVDASRKNAGVGALQAVASIVANQQESANVESLMQRLSATVKGSGDDDSMSPAKRALQQQRRSLANRSAGSDRSSAGSFSEDPAGALGSANLDDDDTGVSTNARSPRMLGRAGSSGTFASSTVKGSADDDDDDLERIFAVDRPTTVSVLKEPKSPRNADDVVSSWKRRKTTAAKTSVVSKTLHHHHNDQKGRRSPAPSSPSTPRVASDTAAAAGTVANDQQLAADLEPLPLTDVAESADNKNKILEEILFHLGASEDGDAAEEAEADGDTAERDGAAVATLSQELGEKPQLMDTPEQQQAAPPKLADVVVEVMALQNASGPPTNCSQEETATGPTEEKSSTTSNPRLPLVAAPPPPVSSTPRVKPSATPRVPPGSTKISTSQAAARSARDAVQQLARAALKNPAQPLPSAKSVARDAGITVGSVSTRRRAGTTRGTGPADSKPHLSSKTHTAPANDSTEQCTSGCARDSAVAPPESAAGDVTAVSTDAPPPGDIVVSEAAAATTDLLPPPGGNDEEHEPHSDADAALRELFENDPEQFGAVVTDLTESVGRRLLALDDPAHDDSELTPLPPPSSDVQRYTVYLPSKLNEEQRRADEAARRSDAERLMREQQELQRVISDILDEVQAVWPTLAPSEGGGAGVSYAKRAEFLQVSMGVAWQAQKRQAHNLKKMIALLDRKVSARGWVPRFNTNDVLEDDDVGFDDVDVSMRATELLETMRKGSRRSAGGACKGRRQGAALHKALSSTKVISQHDFEGAGSSAVVFGVSSGRLLGQAESEIVNRRNVEVDFYESAHVEPMEELDEELESRQYRSRFTAHPPRLQGAVTPAPPRHALRTAHHTFGAASDATVAFSSRGIFPQPPPGSQRLTESHPQVDHRLLFSAHFKRQGELDDFPSSNVRAAARLRAIRHQRLTYHLALRLGLFRDD